MAVKSKPYQLEWKGNPNDELKDVNKRLTEVVYRINSMLDTLFKGVTNTESDTAEATAAADEPADAIALPDTDASHNLAVVAGSNLTADRTLTLTTGDANRTLTLSGDATISGTHTGTSSGTNTGDQSTISGNAATATALQTARNINGVSFNGTADITVPAAASTLTGTALNSGIVDSSLTTFGSPATFTTLNATTGNITTGNFTTVEAVDVNTGDATLTGSISFGSGTNSPLINCSSNTSDNASSFTATLTNAPVSGNPTWLRIILNGSTRYIPVW